MREDTIAAIATAPGEGGIGIVRISGEKAFEILKKIFIPASSFIYCRRRSRNTMPWKYDFSQKNS